MCVTFSPEWFLYFFSVFICRYQLKPMPSETNLQFKGKLSFFSSPLSFFLSLHAHFIILLGPTKPPLTSPVSSPTLCERIKRCAASRHAPCYVTTSFIISCQREWPMTSPFCSLALSSMCGMDLAWPTRARKEMWEMWAVRLSRMCLHSCHQKIHQLWS